MKQFLFFGKIIIWGQITPELIKFLLIFTEMDNLDHLYQALLKPTTRKNIGSLLFIFLVLFLFHLT